MKAGQASGVYLTTTKLDEMTPFQLQTLWDKCNSIHWDSCAFLYLDGTIKYETTGRAKPPNWQVCDPTPDIMREIDGLPMVDLEFTTRMFERKELHMKTAQLVHIRVVYVEVGR